MSEDSRVLFSAEAILVAACATEASRRSRAVAVITAAMAAGGDHPQRGAAVRPRAARCQRCPLGRAVRRTGGGGLMAATAAPVDRCACCGAASVTRGRIAHAPWCRFVEPVRPTHEQRPVAATFDAAGRTIAGMVPTDGEST